MDGRFVKFNGGFSQEQLNWLDKVLTSADEKDEKVTVVSKYRERAETSGCIPF